MQRHSARSGHSLLPARAFAALLALFLAALSACGEKGDEAPPARTADPVPGTTATPPAAPRAADAEGRTEEAAIAAAFKGWGRARQLEYFMALPMEERFLFLREFLPDESLKADADTVVTFRAGGAFELIRGMGTAAQAHSGGAWSAGAGLLRIEPAADGLWPAAPFTALRVEAALDGALEGGLRFVLGSLSAAEAKAAAALARAEAMKAARAKRMPPAKMPVPGGMYEGAAEDAARAPDAVTLKDETLALHLTDLTID